MGVRQYLGPAEPRASLALARFLLSVVILAVLTMLPVVVSRAYHLRDLLLEARLDVTGDVAWTVAQLEVDLLKLQLAVAAISSDPSQTASEVEFSKRWSNVEELFDIFYSRVDTVASRIHSWEGIPDIRDRKQTLLDALILDRDRMDAILDEALKPGGSAQFEPINARLADVASHVRELSLSIVAILSGQATERRLENMREFRSLLILSVVIVVVMVLTGLSAWFLFRQIGVRAAAEQRIGENLYRVLDAKGRAMLLTDSNQKILWINKTATKLLGATEAEAKGHHAPDLFFPGVQRIARQGGTHPLTTKEQSKECVTFRDVIRRPGGGTLAAEVTRIRLKAPYQNDTIALLIHDISETQHAMRALRRERRLAEAESDRYRRFLAVMSHEIRSPLHAIIASLDLLRRRPDTQATAELHDIAMNAAQAALHEADAVLEIGRAETEMNATELVTFTPCEVIHNLVEMNRPVARSAGTEFSVEIGPGAEGCILGRRACFWHAISNLVSNAVKVTRGGRIDLRLSRCEGELRVEVTDDGPGIAPELQSLIFRDHYSFEPVTTGQRRGMGLGLGIFASAVEAMSGQYGFQSEPGQGSTFWFVFPAPPAERQVPVQIEGTSSTAPLPDDLRVLVVDDSHINRTLIKQMLETLGQHTDLAASGVEAVKLAQAFAYDLILMDLTMPGMDGFCAAAAIRKAGVSQRACILALTANVLAHQKVRQPGSAFDYMLLKPLRLGELRDCLATCARRRSAPLVDPAVAQDILAMMPRPSIESLLKILFDEAHEMARHLERGRTPSELSPGFHGIAGSAGMLGAVRLRDLALEGETSCKEQGLAPNFAALWTETIAETSHEWETLVARHAASAYATT